MKSRFDTSPVSFKGEIRNRFNLISEERVNNFEHNSEKFIKIGWKIRSYKKIRKFTLNIDMNNYAN